MYWKPGIPFSPPKNPTIGLTDMPGMKAPAAATTRNVPGECRSGDEVVITPIIARLIDIGTVFECLNEVLFCWLRHRNSRGELLEDGISPGLFPIRYRDGCCCRVPDGIHREALPDKKSRRPECMFTLAARYWRMSDWSSPARYLITGL